MNPFINDFRSYIGLTLCGQLFELCRNKQFEAMHCGDFVNFINLRPTNQPIKIKDGENLRLSYLIFVLGTEVVDSDYSAHWINTMLAQCCITKKFYSSYKKYLISDDTRKNIEFKESLHQAIERADKFDKGL